MIVENQETKKIDNKNIDRKKENEKKEENINIENKLSENLQIEEIKIETLKEDILKNNETKEYSKTNQLLNDKSTKIDIKTKNKKKKQLTIEECEKKIKENIFIIKICFIISISINIIDIIIIIIFPSIFLDIFNIICLILITISSILILIKYILKSIIITSSYYKETKKNLIYSSVIVGIYFCNILYVMIHKIMLNSVKNFDAYQIFLGIILIFCYSIINISGPIMILIKLGEVKNQIQKISLLRNQNTLNFSGNSSLQNDIFFIQQKEKRSIIKSINNSFSIKPQLKENNKNKNN